MNKCYLDANILIFFKNEESSYYKKAREIISQLVENDFSLFISPLVLDEFLHGVKTLLIYKKLNQRQIYHLLEKSLNDILYLPNLKILSLPTNFNKQLQVVSLMKQYNLKPRDAYHLLTLQENNIKYFATFDKDFKEVFQEKLILPV